MTTDPGRPLTEREAAEYLRVAPRTLQRWRQLGRGPRFVRAGRRVLYRQRDLDDWLDQGGNEKSPRNP
jgi:excisionase family DNA binding protein